MDLGRLIEQFTGGQPPAGVPPQTGQWLQQYQAGNLDQVPHDQVHQAYQQWSQAVPPEQAQQSLHYGYQQVPQQQVPGIGSTLLNLFQQQGLNPQAAGVSTTNPQQMGPQDLARMTQYAQQQQPDVLHQLFQSGGALSNPMVGMALAGALAYGATKFIR